VVKIAKTDVIKMIKNFFTILIVLISCFIYSAESPASAADKEVITVAAASSFSYALTEIKAGFEANGRSRVRLVFGSSGLLARQIQGGAPFDVFISANSGFMDDLVSSGAVGADSMRSFARGVLVLAAGKEDSDNIKGLKSLLDKKIRRVAIANPAHAPYGRAAVEVLKKTGLLEKIRKKLVYGENVRQALQFVESGNASAGFIALSIAKRPGIKAIAVDPSLYNPIEQSAAVVKTTAHGKAAEDFIGYLTGAEGMRILRKYGFKKP